MLELLIAFLNIPFEVGFSEPYFILPLWLALLGILIGVPACFFACVLLQVWVWEPMALEMEPAWGRWLDAHFPWGPLRQDGTRIKVMGFTGWVMLPFLWCGLMMWMVEALVFNVLIHRSFGLGFDAWYLLLVREFPHKPLPDQI